MPMPKYIKPLLVLKLMPRPLLKAWYIRLLHKHNGTLFLLWLVILTCMLQMKMKMMIRQIKMWSLILFQWTGSVLRRYLSS